MFASPCNCVIQLLSSVFFFSFAHVKADTKRMASKKWSQFILVCDHDENASANGMQPFITDFSSTLKVCITRDFYPVGDFFRIFFVWRQGISTALILLLSDYHTCCKRRGACAFGTISTSSKIYIDKFFCQPNRVQIILVLNHFKRMGENSIQVIMS